MRDWVLRFLVRTWDTFFGIIVGIDFGVMLRGKGPHESEFTYDIVPIQPLMIYTDLIEYNIVGDTKTAFLRRFGFVSML